MSALASAFAAWDRAMSLGHDATAADWSAVADAWRGLDAYSAEQRATEADQRALAIAMRAWVGGAS